MKKMFLVAVACYVLTGSIFAMEESIKQRNPGAKRSRGSDFVVNNPSKEVDSEARHSQEPHDKKVKNLSDLNVPDRGANEPIVKKLKKDSAGLQAESNKPEVMEKITIRPPYEGTADDMKKLIEDGDVNTADEDGWSLLHSVVKAGKKDCLELLLKAGIKLDLPYKNEWTALHFAARQGKTECMKALLEAGADIEAKDSKRTPLHFAAVYGHVECIKVLIKKGAEIEAKTNQVGWTPLLLAAEEGNIDCVKALIEAGANIEAKNILGWTPLYCAALFGEVECLQALLKAGADIEAKTNEGKTAFSLAKEKSHWEVLAAFKEYQDSQDGVEDEKDGSLVIKEQVFVVPGKLFKISGTLKDLIEDVESNKEVPVDYATEAIWNLLNEKIEGICADAVKVEHLKSIDEKKFIGSNYYKTLKKKYCDYYAQYTSEEIAGLLNLCNYLDIPFLVDVFTDTYAKVECEKLDKNVHKDCRISVLKAMGVWFISRADELDKK